jgi:Kef-type K+ transport system membrane component KefB
MAITIENLELARFFLAISLLLVSAHFFGYIFTKLKMPKVVGEIFGGLLLGPTFLGYFAPSIYNKLFLEEGKLLAIIYWFGLVLLMFTSGFELERKFNRNDKKTIVWLVIGSTIFPLFFAWISTSFFDLPALAGTANNILALKLIIVVSIAVTSIPVLSKIFIDLDIIKTRFAKIILSTATFHDVILWVFVAVATALTAGYTISLGTISTHVAISLALFAIALMIAPRLIKFVDNLRLNLIPKNYEVGLIIFILLVFVVISGYFNINVVFGAFLAGIVVGFIKNQKFRKAKVHIKEFSFALFVPIYFAIVGIKLDLIHHLDFMFAILFFIFAFLAQGIGVAITSKLLGYGWTTTANFAIALNDRGGPGIVVATLAYDLGIINENFFVTLILLAVLTSITAGTWLRFVLGKRWKLMDQSR